MAFESGSGGNNVIDELYTQIRYLNSDIDELRSRITELEERNKELSKKYVDISAYVGYLEKTYDHKRTEIKPNE